MRKIILYSAVTLDSLIAGPNDELDWLSSIGNKEDGDYGYADFYNSIDTTLSGNRTYELILTFGKFPYPEKKNYVFTRNKNVQNTNFVEFVNSDILSFVKNLKLQSGKDIWLVGGGILNTSLLNENLIDEMLLTVFPVILGNGKPLFTNDAAFNKFNSVSTKTYKSGLVQLHYSK